MASRKLEIEIVGDASSLNRALGSAGKESGGFGSKLAGLGKTAALVGGAAGIGALAAGLKIGIDEYSQAQKVTAQTNAAIKSTGGVANVTTKDITDLSGALMKKSGVDDEAIQSGENMLLTFKNIRNETGKGNDIFTQTTKTMLDMSTALGKDNPQAAMMLGKALNDPIKGMSALARVGVTFTDAQKKQVAAMVESGNTMGAQKLILHELNSEFGGSAKAMGETLPGQINIAKETFNNFAGDLVAKTIPVIERVIATVRDHWPEIQKVLNQVWANVKPVLVELGQLLAAVAGIIKQNWPAISKIIKQQWDVIRPILDALKSALKLIVDLLHGDWGKAWGDAKAIVLDVGKALLANVKGWISIFGGLALKIAGAFKDGLVAGFRGLAGLMRSLLGAAVNPFIAAWDSLRIPGFHIHIPIPLAPDVDFGWGGFDLPDIPMLAKGGLIKSPTLAFLGEKGQEAVVPLSRGIGAGVGLGTTVHVSVGPVYGRVDASFARALAPALADQLRGNRVPQLSQAIKAL